VGDFLSGYSIQNWLESCPQGYLEDTEYGHLVGEKEPALLFDNKELLEQAIQTTVQLVVGERCALSASSGLINIAPDFPSKRFLATQTLDEARHVEIFTQRLHDLGVAKNDLESTIDHFANPHLVRFAEVLLEKIDKGDFIAGVVGQNIVLEGMAFSVFEMMHAGNQQMNPKFAHTLSGTIADERRHVGFGENRIGSTFSLAFSQNTQAFEVGRDLAQKAAEESGEPREARTWHGADLATASPEEMEAVLADTVLHEFKVRLGRIGIDYQTPSAP
jgi:hypothetical protein